MQFPTTIYNVETGEHVETITAEPIVKFDDKLKEEILSQIQEEGMVIPQSGGFFVQNIRRNKSDVYNVNIG